MEKTILLPLDFSEQSLIALEQSYNLAKLSKASITILNVIKTTSGFWGVFSDEDKKEYEKKIEKKLKETAKKIDTEQGIDVRIIIRKGKTIEEIMRVADYLTPMVIIMGTSSGKSITRKIIGSKTLHVIKTSKYPVISIKGKEFSTSCKNILLPIDASKNTSQKVDLAIKLAKIFKSKITVVTAISKKNLSLIEKVNATLSEIKSKIENNKIICETDFIHADDDKARMAKALLNYAHKVNADMVSIMTQQEHDISEFFLGSLAQNIIFSFDIPVLTITPKQKK